MYLCDTAGNVDSHRVYSFLTHSSGTKFSGRMVMNKYTSRAQDVAGLEVKNRLLMRSLLCLGSFFFCLPSVWMESVRIRTGLAEREGYACLRPVVKPVIVCVCVHTSKHIYTKFIGGGRWTHLMCES